MLWYTIIVIRSLDIPHRLRVPPGDLQKDTLLTVLSGILSSKAGTIYIYILVKLHLLKQGRYCVVQYPLHEYSMWYNSNGLL